MVMRSRLLQLIAIAIVAVTLLLWITFRFIQLLKCEKAAEQNALTLQLAFEMWSVDAQLAEQYTAKRPRDPSAYIKQGYLEAMPENPFSHQPVRVLDWGEKPEAGDVLFLNAKKYFQYKDQPQFETDLGYLLLVYSVRRRKGALNQFTLDLDGNGKADSIMTILQPGYVKGDPSSWAEDIADTLRRYGYPLPLDADLPYDYAAIWRYMLCIPE
jgi:hypothetical protein